MEKLKEKVVDKTFEGIIDKVFDGFKKITPALLTICIVTGLILFLPDSILEKMALNSLSDTFKQAIGVIFLFCISMICTLMCLYCRTKIAKAWQHKRAQRNMIGKLKSLSKEQKEVLNNLLKSKDKSVMLDSNSGITIYLLSRGFIVRPEQLLSLGESDSLFFRYVPAPWLMSMYEENPKVKSILEK